MGVGGDGGGGAFGGGGAGMVCGGSRVWWCVGVVGMMSCYTYSRNFIT